MIARTMKNLAPLALMAVATAAAVGCGGGGDDTAKTPAPSSIASGRAATRTAPATAAATSPTVASGAGATSTAVPANTPTRVPAAPPSAPTQSAPQPTQATAPVSITVVAKNIRFEPTALSAAVGATLNVTLDNQDAGIPHNIIFFDPAGAQIAASEIATGPNTRPVVFTPAAAGSYAFDCSVHTSQMTGTLTVQ